MHILRKHIKIIALSLVTIIAALFLLGYALNEDKSIGKLTPSIAEVETI